MPTVINNANERPSHASRIVDGALWAVGFTIAAGTLHLLWGQITKDRSSKDDADSDDDNDD